MDTFTETQPLDRTSRASGAARAAGIAAAVLGTPYALLNVYWAAGGTRLLAQYGSHVFGRAVPGDTAFQVTSAALAVLMGIGVVSGVLATRVGAGALTRWAAWLSAGWIALYGGAMTFVGIAVPLAVYSDTPGIDADLYRWHVLFWDPWYLVWGLVLLAAVSLSFRKDDDATY